MFAPTYWPPEYWPTTYWAKEGSDPPDGYWPPRYWTKGYFWPNYWVGEPMPVIPPEPPVTPKRVPYMLMEVNGVGRVGM